MTATELLEELRVLGVSVSFNRDKLHIEVPPGVNIEGLKPELIQHKQELISLIQSRTERVEYVGNLPAIIVNNQNPIDYRRSPATGRWIHDPGWWKQISRRGGNRDETEA